MSDSGSAQDFDFNNSDGEDNFIVDEDLKQEYDDYELETNKEEILHKMAFILDKQDRNNK